MDFAQQLEREERRNERISAIITTVIMVLLLLLSFMWQAFRSRVPPIGAKEYEVVGAIDFGDYKNGSRSVNNFEKAVENPVEAKKPAAKPVPEVEVADNNPPPVKEVVTEAPSPVSQPEPPVKPDPTPTPTPPKTVTEPKKEPVTETKNNTSETSEPSLDDDLLYDPNDNATSGSNHGDAESGTGNAGTPDVKVLDPDGLYSFGTGSKGGLKGRSPLALPQPKYTVQEEGDLEFEFIIRPDGSVAYVKLVGGTTELGLKQAGIDAIEKWRFSASPGAANQRVKVTIKFRLKG
ncbi:MAG: TonB family protein [Bacteroidota bacterium]